MNDLTHFSDSGRARMVDVSDKSSTQRVAIASGILRMQPATLERIRAGRMQPGVAALFAAAGRDPQRAGSTDFGFALGPRLNAAGRLADMSIGIACLLCDDPAQAAELARTLDAINRERRDVEAGMREQAALLLESLMPAGTPPPAIVLHDEAFHEGVVGIVAGRLKERLHRPTFVFALGGDGLLKGSALTAARLARCHPWARGGVDDVPLHAHFRHDLTRYGFVVPSTDEAPAGASPRKD